jgi:hypothetical protein
MPHAMPLLGTLSRAGYLALCDPVSCDDPLAEPRAIQAQAGATVRVKWRALDADGAPVSDARHFARVSSSAATAREADDAGGSGPEYLGDGYGRFHGQTPIAYAGQRRTMTLSLRDGTSRSALLQFT